VVITFSEGYPSLMPPDESLDPLISEFSRLVDQKLNEQSYQSFLEAHPQFIPRFFIQVRGLNLQQIVVTLLIKF